MNTMRSLRLTDQSKSSDYSGIRKECLVNDELGPDLVTAFNERFNLLQLININISFKDILPIERDKKCHTSEDKKCIIIGAPSRFCL